MQSGRLHLSLWWLGARLQRHCMLSHMLMLNNGHFQCSFSSSLFLPEKPFLNYLHLINHTILKLRTHGIWMVMNLDFDFVCCSRYLEQLIVLACNSLINPRLLKNLIKILAEKNNFLLQVHNSLSLAICCVFII